MQIDIGETAREQLDALCEEDIRSYEEEVAWLIREEKKRRSLIKYQYPSNTTNTQPWLQQLGH